VRSPLPWERGLSGTPGEKNMALEISDLCHYVPPPWESYTVMNYHRKAAVQSVSGTESLSRMIYH